MVYDNAGWTAKEAMEKNVLLGLPSVKSPFNLVWSYTCVLRVQFFIWQGKDAILSSLMHLLRRWLKSFPWLEGEARYLAQFYALKLIEENASPYTQGKKKYSCLKFWERIVNFWPFNIPRYLRRINVLLNTFYSRFTKQHGAVCAN